MANDVHFDEHQFQRKHAQQPVDAHCTQEGWESTGISFQDYSGMHVVARKMQGHDRRLPTPEWAVNDSQLRDLLVCFLENRAGFRRKPQGELKDRLARAVTAIQAKRERLVSVLDNLCAEYADRKAQPTSDTPTILRRLEIQIENIDTSIRMITGNGGAEIVLRVVHLYHRLRWDSPAVAAEMNLKPPHVRMIIFRLARVWDEMHGIPRPISVPSDKAFIAQAAELYLGGMKPRDIAVKLGCNIDRHGDPQTYRVLNALKVAGVYRTLPKTSKPPREQKSPWIYCANCGVRRQLNTTCHVCGYVPKVHEVPLSRDGYRLTKAQARLKRLEAKVAKALEKATEKAAAKARWEMAEKIRFAKAEVERLTALLTAHVKSGMPENADMSIQAAAA